MSEQPLYSSFTSEFKVRPDDIDMFNHVHNSTYFDYVLAARYDQMERFYGMSMEEFMSKGYGWVVRTAFVDYKRPLGLGDEFAVKTGIETINNKGCKVKFEIVNKKTNKILFHTRYGNTIHLLMEPINNDLQIVNLYL